MNNCNLTHEILMVTRYRHIARGTSSTKMNMVQALKTPKKFPRQLQVLLLFVRMK